MEKTPSVFCLTTSQGDFLTNMLLILSSVKMHRKGILFFSLSVNETQYERLNGCLCLQRNDLMQQI